MTGPSRRPPPRGSLRRSAGAAWPLGRAPARRVHRQRPSRLGAASGASADPRALTRCRRPTPPARCRPPTAPSGNLTLLGDQRRHRRSPSSTCSPRTACGSSARSRTSAPACPATSCSTRRAGRLLHRLQAGHGRRRHPRRRSRSPTPVRTLRRAATTRSWSSRPTRHYQPTSRTRPSSCVTKTEKFVDLYKAGKDDEARALYPVARVHWERIEPVAESFGDLDPKMDLREADLEHGPEVDRLAPDREGPVAGAGQGLPRAEHGRAGRSTPTT